MNFRDHLHLYCFYLPLPSVCNVISTVFWCVKIKQFIDQTVKQFQLLLEYILHFGCVYFDAVLSVTEVMWLCLFWQRSFCNSPHCWLILHVPLHKRLHSVCYANFERLHVGLCRLPRDWCYLLVNWVLMEERVPQNKLQGQADCLEEKNRWTGIH